MVNLMASRIVKKDTFASMRMMAVHLQNGMVADDVTAEKLMVTYQSVLDSMEDSRCVTVVDVKSAGGMMWTRQVCMV